MTDWALTPQAEQDILDIYLYGAETFGATVALGYVDSLTDCFLMLAAQPRIGRLAKTTHRGARRFEHGRHVIYYEERPPGILMLAIVHGRSVRGLPD